MTKQVSKDAARALMNHEKFKRGNTKVEVDSDGAAYLKLFHNTIACHEADGTLKITNAGWSSVTTKDRLNALPHVNIDQRNYTWYLHDEEWDGDWDIVYNSDPTGKEWGRALPDGDDSLEVIE